MTMQEIWEAKEKLSDKIWGKSAEEMSEIMKPNVDAMKLKIEEIRKKNKEGALLKPYEEARAEST